jgi:anaerobic magnesium-protoporphyrin IX monomethyl ester cyclase
MAINIALVYQYFHPANDNSIFRFPPLSLGYIAASLKKHGFEVDLVDCTFMQFNEAVEREKNAQLRILVFTQCFQ